MQADRKPSLREIARQSGYSIATVSEALRGSPRVRSATQEAILKVARELGYESNFLVGNMMSHLRRSRVNSFKGVLVVLETKRFHESRRTSRWHKELFQACTEQSERLGYKLDFIRFEQSKKSLHHLDKVLRHRGVNGILVPPFREANDLSLLDWDRYCGVQLDYGLKNFRLNTVCPDHHLSMIKLLRELRKRGYQRPGLALELEKDRRIMMKWHGAYYSFCRMNNDIDPVPVHFEETLDPEQFFKWYQASKPDVIIGHRARILDWLNDSDLTVPEDVGFTCLNMHDCRLETAGIDLQPGEIGRMAIKNLVSLIFQQDFGIPKTPHTITVEGTWVDGPTVREIPLLSGQAAKTI
jgi:LacI family transcriptional regulator